MADKKISRKKVVRATSNVFAMFEQSQVQEFKEAFNMFDQDRDGTISADDLKEIYSSLGKVAKDVDLKAMLDEASGPINFTMMLTLFGDRLNGTDDENVILNAFRIYDDSGNSHLDLKLLREMLVGEGNPEERLTEQEFNKAIEGAPLDQKGNLDYTTFTRIIKRGKQDDE